MCTGVEIALLAGAATSAAVGVYNGEQSRKTQHTAQDNAKAQAEKTEAAATNATNKANARGPDSGALLASNMLAGMNGGGTSLTGPGGVDPSKLTLGKSSLLGG